MLFVAYSGIVDPSATRDHYPGVQWFLESVRHHGIESRTDDLTVPDLSSQSLFESGLAHYHEMCVTCHGAPGVERSEIGHGLNPSPPDLAAATFDDHEAAEAFWIVKHGIRMTGMPAFGSTHSDEEIWGLVAVQKRLAELTPEDYARLTQNVEHHHGDGGHVPENEPDSQPSESSDGHDHGSHDHGP